MDLSKYSYIEVPAFTGDSLRDAKRLLRANGKEATLAHVCAVADECTGLARRFSLSEERCRLCGVLHDVGAVMRPEDMLSFARERGMAVDFAEERHPFLLHQRLSEILSRELLGVEDGAVLSAVGCHTTLKEKPSPYDMALFLADKLAWDQEGTPPYAQAVRGALARSLEGACLTYIDYALLNGRVLCPHRWLLQAHASLKRHSEI